MDIDTARDKRNLLFECIAGSRAYGLDSADSDTDVRGVFVLPQNEFYGLGYTPQAANESNDAVFFELKRFFELLSRNNPNILELLFLPRDCILYKHPLFDLIKPELFISKLCRETFAGYAVAQIKKAHGLKKKIVNPVGAERKSIMDFCRVIQGQHSISLHSWLKKKDIDPLCCGLAAVSNVKSTYALFIDEHNEHGFNGISKNALSQDVALSGIPKGLRPSALIYVNKDGYSRYCKEYQEYWEWVEHRNDARYRNTLSHGKNYDSKNMMHTFRLLDVAEEIALTGRFEVRRPNRAELLEIKSGAYEFDDLVNRAQEKLMRIKELFAESSLPDHPDLSDIDRLLIEVRSMFYS